MQRYLLTAESFYVDVIRYLVAGWYPSNQILQSDIVPRYVVIGSLLRAIKVTKKNLFVQRCRNSCNKLFLESRGRCQCQDCFDL